MLEYVDPFSAEEDEKHLTLEDIEALKACKEAGI